MYSLELKLLVWILFFSAEIAILSICYKHIYQKKHRTNRSLGEYFKMLLKYYIFMIQYRLAFYEKNDGLDVLLDENQELRDRMFLWATIGTASIFLLPCVIVMLIGNARLFGWVILLWAAGMSLFLDKIKEYRLHLMSMLKQSQKFLSRFSIKRVCVAKRTDGRHGHRKNEMPPFKRFGEVIKNVGAINFILLMLMIIYAVFMEVVIFRKWKAEGIVIFSCNLTSMVFWAKLFAPLFLLIIVRQLIDKEGRINICEKLKCFASGKKKSEGQSENGIYIYGDLCAWRDEIFRMCHELKIRNLELGLADLGAKKVVCIILKGQMPQIVIDTKTYYNICQSYQQDYSEIIKMLIAHELVHIYYKDPVASHDRWRLIKIFLFNTLAFIGMLAVVLHFGCNRWIVYLIMLLMATVTWEMKILCDKRYWGQVKEFRADRIGIKVSKVRVEIFQEALACTSEKDGNMEKKNIIQNIYEKNVEVQIHPSLDRRIYEVRRGKEWKNREYLRYLCLIGWNRFIKKGWNI